MTFCAKPNGDVLVDRIVNAPVVSHREHWYVYPFVCLPGDGMGVRMLSPLT